MCYNLFKENNTMKLNESEQKNLTIPEIIEYCKNNLGITFNLMDEEKAKSFLEKHNYFFRLKQYAEVAQEKTKSGKYIGIDFGHLVELSTIDMFFRKLILKMTIDFEHYLKVSLINECQSNDADDGYLVVNKFLEKNKKIQTILENLNYNNIVFYNKNSFLKYMEKPSVWSLIEVIQFSDFIDFYSFYYDFFHLKCEYTKHFESVRRLRNAAAHNACMLCSFKPAQWFHFDAETSFDLLGANLGINNGTITNCMKVPVLNDFAVMLSVYTRLISSEPIKQKTFEEIIDFFDNRMILRKQYFEGNTEIKNAYQFARKVLKYYSKM